MRVLDIYHQVAQLGFDESLESEEGFLFALNRAIVQVSALRPQTVGYDIHHKPPANKATPNGHTPVLLCEDGGAVYMATGAKAYYFEADGAGVAYIEIKDPAGEHWEKVGEVDFASVGFAPYRGHIRRDGNFPSEGDEVRICLAANTRAYVRSVALYDRLDGEAEADIPAYEAYTRYDMSALVPDFLSFDGSPRQESGATLRVSRDYLVENDRVLLLPETGAGVYRVIYRVCPPVMMSGSDAAEDETPIPLDHDLCVLLPLLVAAYVWMDDEPEKAQYYLSLYEARALDVVERQVNIRPTRMFSTNGW